MSLIFKATEDGGDFKRLPDGTYFGRLVQIFGLGVQVTKFDDTPGYRLLLSFEVPSETTEDGRSMMISKEVKFSGHPKSNLHGIVVALLGKEAGGDTMKKGLDFNELAGKQVMLTIGSTQTGNATIKSFAPTPDGTQVPEATIPLLVVDPDELDEETRKKTPAWILKKIDERQDKDTGTEGSAPVEF